MSYIFASEVQGDYAYQVVPSGKWTRVVWSDMRAPGSQGFNTSGWSLDADGATFILGGALKDHGLWAASASVAWEPWGSGTDMLLPAHLRKMRGVSGVASQHPPTAIPLSLTPPGQYRLTPTVVSEMGTEFHPECYDGVLSDKPAGSDNYQVTQTYCQPGFQPQSPIYDHHRYWCEVYQNSGHAVRIVKHGGESGDIKMGGIKMCAPLAMLAKLDGW